MELIHLYWRIGAKNLRKVFGEVSLRKRLDTVIMGLCSTRHTLSPPVRDDALGDLGIRPIKSIEKGPLGISRMFIAPEN